MSITNMFTIYVDIHFPKKTVWTRTEGRMGEIRVASGLGISVGRWVRVCGWVGGWVGLCGCVAVWVGGCGWKMRARQAVGRGQNVPR